MICIAYVRAVLSSRTCCRTAHRSGVRSDVSFQTLPPTAPLPKHGRGQAHQMPVEAPCEATPATEAMNMSKNARTDFVEFCYVVSRPEDIDLK
jgi:hypothetical protein